MKKINRLEKSRKEAGASYSNIDRGDELVYNMDNQEFKNLHKLDNYKILLNQGEGAGVRKESMKIKRSYSEAYKTQSTSLTGDKGKEFYKDNFGTMNLNRKVRIRQYAPEAFARIRKLSQIKDD